MLQYQNRKVKEMVMHAGKNVPYYRNLFSEIGLDINSFNGIEDLQKIPLLDKESIRKNPEAFLADGYQKFGGGWTKTSGSTGTPLKLWIDNISKAYKYAAVIRAYREAGYSFYIKSFLIQGYSARHKNPFGFRRSTNSIFFNAIRNNEETFLQFYPLWIKHKPKFILGYTRVVAQMCRYMVKNGLTPPKVNAIVNYGENVTAHDVEFVKSILKCEFFDLYSHTENSAMISTLKSGKLCLTEDYFFPEVIGNNGDKIIEGPGELVGTSFYNYSMPLLRYRTRDIVNIKAKNNTSFAEVKNIVGRQNDKIILPDGTEIFFIEDPLSMGHGKVVAAQYVQEKQGELIVNVIAEEGFKQEYFSEMEILFRKRLGNALTYKFNIVNELEKRGDGKVPFIINKL